MVPAPPMKKTQLLKQFVLIGLALFLTTKIQAQCSWMAVESDGFEYTGPIPYVVPGTIIHPNPQTFAAHSGTYSMYMNFVNCSGGTGTCAGDKVYERPFTLCPNAPFRISMYMTTTFSGGASCNMKIVISDANGVGLDSILSFAAPLNPTWAKFTSASLTASTPTVILTMYTNVDGGNGNDLSVDDMKLEQCFSVSSATGYPLCSNIPSQDLFTVLPNDPDSSGTWSGPSVLGGAYLGTFILGTHSTGTYFYNSTPYGTSPGCPARVDTLVVFPAAAPVVNLANDTALCTNQTLLLVAGSGGGNSYLWNTGATTASITASTNSSADTNITYSVQVTNQAGCTAMDSTVISFIICSGLATVPAISLPDIYPNPAMNAVTVRFTSPFTGDINFILRDVQGMLVYKGHMSGGMHEFSLPDLESGWYVCQVIRAGVVLYSGPLIIQMK